MFIITVVSETLRRYRMRRNRERLATILSGLSDQVQKDIGWPTPDETRPLARGRRP